MAKQKFDVLTHVTHDGKAFEAGSKIELDEDQAAPLLEVKAIGEKAKATKVKVDPDGNPVDPEKTEG